MLLMQEISELVQKGRAKVIGEKVQEAIDQGITAQQILNDGLLDGMGKIGEKFKTNEVFVPEVLISARALNKGMEVLQAKILEEGVKPIGKVVVATVKGDLHDIGKNLVAMMLKGTGFEVIDLGSDVPGSKIVDAIKEHSPDIVALSALLTTTMGQMESTIQAIKEAGLRESLKVMVGGAPVTQTYCDLIGADAYADDAASCAEIAKTFVL